MDYFNVESHNEYENVMRYHPVQDGQPERYKRLRDEFIALADTVNELAPDGRVKSLAFETLEWALMRATQAIATGEG